MMYLLDHVFNNMFEDPKIRPSRFYNFCLAVYDAMSSVNTDGRYDAAQAKIEAVTDAMLSKISNVDTGLHTQVNNTKKVKQVMTEFKQFMKDNSGAIAYAAGGNTTNIYRMFYPYGIKEYRLVNKTRMNKLVSRVNGVAGKYAEQLGSRLVADLQAFKPAYKAALTAQRQQMAGVDINRLGRNKAFLDGQKTMTFVVHEVANLNSDNPEEAKNLFPFRMLYPQTKSFIIKEEGKLAAAESNEIANRTLTPLAEITVDNISANADAIVWLALLQTDEAPATAIVIKANSKKVIKAEQLGDLKRTFLIIKNRSQINEVTYSVEIAGLKKGKGAKLVKKAKKMGVVKGDKTA